MTAAENANEKQSAFGKKEEICNICKGLANKTPSTKVKEVRNIKGKLKSEDSGRKMEADPPSVEVSSLGLPAGTSCTTLGTTCGTTRGATLSTSFSTTLMATTHICTTHSQMLGKFEYTRGPIFKVVLEC